MEKQNKAALIRQYLADHPEAKVKDVAATLKVNPAYVYLVKGGAKKRAKKRVAPAANGIAKTDTRIDNLHKDIHGLRSELDAARAVIRYLESRLGASV